MSKMINTYDEYVLIKSNLKTDKKTPRETNVKKLGEKKHLPCG